MTSNTIKMICVSIFFALFNMQVFAEDGVDPGELSDIQEKTSEFVSSSEMTRDALNDFSEKMGIEYGEEDEKGRTFYNAIETVPVDITNPQWGKWRVVAYKKAVAKIKQSFLEDSYGSIAGETLTKYASDDSDNRMEFPAESDPRVKSKTSEIWDKLVALTGAKLDAALRDLDIDPEEYNALSKERKKNIFRNNFTEKSVKKAAGSLAGLMTIKTFEGKDTKGNYTIGVVAMYKRSLKQLAYDISKGREPMLTLKKGKKGRNVKSYIPKSKKVLSDTFGVRLAFDETNSPVLISYGQWSYMYKGKSQKKLDRGYEHALKKAKTEAEKQLAQFVKSNAQFQEMEETSAIEEENAVLNPSDGMVHSEDIAEMVDKISSTMKVKFKFDLGGRKIAKKTSYKHPSGHEIVMVVAVWSQKNVNQTNEVRKFKPQKSKKTSTPKTKKVIDAGPASVGEGVGMDTDF